MNLLNLPEDVLGVIVSNLSLKERLGRFGNASTAAVALARSLPLRKLDFRDFPEAFFSLRDNLNYVENNMSMNDDEVLTAVEVKARAWLEASTILTQLPLRTVEHLTFDDAYHSLLWYEEMNIIELVELLKLFPNLRSFRGSDVIAVCPKGEKNSFSHGLISIIHDPLAYPPPFTPPKKDYNSKPNLKPSLLPTSTSYPMTLAQVRAALPKLESLRLSGCYADAFFIDVSNLRRVRIDNVFRNYRYMAREPNPVAIANFWVAVSKAPNLEVVKVEFELVPQGPLPNLRKLKCEIRGETSVLEMVEAMSSLESVDLKLVKLDRLPTFENMRALRSLSLRVFQNELEPKTFSTANFRIQVPLLVLKIEDLTRSLSLQQFGDLSQLRTLSFGMERGCDFNSESINLLATVRQLKGLIIRGKIESLDGLASSLANLKSLVTLRLINERSQPSNEMTLEIVHALQSIPALSSLYLEGFPIDNLSARAIGSFAELNVLTLAIVQETISDDWFFSLQPLPRLHSLHICNARRSLRGPGISQSAIERLCSQFPRMTYFELDYVTKGLPMEFCNNPMPTTAFSAIREEEGLLRFVVSLASFSDY